MKCMNRKILFALAIMNLIIISGCIQTTQEKEDPCYNIKDAMQCVKNESCQPILGPSSCSPDGKICTGDMVFKRCVSKE